MFDKEVEKSNLKIRRITLHAVKVETPLKTCQ